MKYSCIIVDDEDRAHVVLENYINKLSFLSLEYNAYNAEAAYDYLRNHFVDIILLDINMPEIDGFGLINLLTYKPSIIITTAYTEYALQSFDYGVVDYLHKPIRFERFIQAIHRAIKWKTANDDDVKWKVIQLKIENAVHNVHTADILYVESMRNYVKIVCKNKTLVMLITTADMENMLLSSAFARVHKSYIVNLMESTLQHDGKIKIGNIILPVGKVYKKYIERLISLPLHPPIK